MLMKRWHVCDPNASIKKIKTWLWGVCLDHLWCLPSYLQFWNQTKAHIFLITSAKFQAKMMLCLEDISNKSSESLCKIAYG